MRNLIVGLFMLLCAPAFSQQQTPPIIDFESVPNPLRLPDNMYFGEVSGIAVNSKGHVFVLSRGKTPLALALIGSGTYGLFQLQVTSAFTAFLSGGLVLIPLLVMLTEGLVNDLSRGRVQWQR